MTVSKDAEGRVTSPRGITVVLDANAVIKDPRLESAAASVLLTNSAAGNIRVAIPEVALQEAIHDFCEQARKAHGEIQRQLKTLSRLGLGADFRTKSIDDLCTKYEAELKQWLKKNEVAVLDFPAISHRDMARMAIQKRRPFDDQGRGYRDALVWLSVIELVSTTDVWLVSNDNDFRAPKSEGIADALVKDLDATGRDSSDVRLFRFVTDCVAELERAIVQPKFDVGKRLKDDLAYHTGVLSVIESELLYREVDAAQLSYPLSRADVASIDSVQDVQQIYITDARQLASDELFVRLDAIVEVELELLIEKSEIAAIERDLGGVIRVGDWDFNPRYVSAYATANLNVLISAIADANSFDLKRVDVDEYTVLDGG
jgi:hypothetical protein